MRHHDLDCGYAGFLVDVLLYTGQHLQSETFGTRRAAERAVIELRALTMVEAVSLICCETGEVIESADSHTVLAGRVYPRL